ncbi:flavin-containing monooxygenase 9 [Biscogniauxia mediterranea]|nr:flavin-containing monooxygenase 9 [Biscogniauxia mediterranea]
MRCMYTDSIYWDSTPRLSVACLFAKSVTTANISKYTCGMSDFPIPDKYPHYMSQKHFQEYMWSYAEHFDLFKDIVFNASLKRVSRNKEDMKWLLEVVVDGELREFEYDKVALCHGYQTKAELPELKGRERFEGIVMHSQAFRSPEPFRGKRVVILGLGPSAEYVVTELKPVAFKMWQNGSPVDLLVTLRRRRMSTFMQRNFPLVARAISDMVMSFFMKKSWGALDPAWRLIPFPSLHYTLPSLGDGTLNSMYGLKRFVGSKSVEFDDETVLDYMDAVICATGYSGDLSNYGGLPLVRMWKNMFPPQYAGSLCLLCYSAFWKNNGFSFNDLISMAKEIDAHQKWVPSMWCVDDKIDTSMGWKFWLKDPTMYNLTNYGVETAHAFRFFETDNRKAWPGARYGIIYVNEIVNIFPIKDMKFNLQSQYRREEPLQAL